MACIVVTRTHMSSTLAYDLCDQAPGHRGADATTEYIPVAGLAFTLQYWKTKYSTPQLRQLRAC